MRIFDIQRFSVQDGPGIRTTVFLKGCGMRCKWCHNPESHSSEVQLAYYAHKCIHCGMCSKVCKHHAHTMVNGKHEFFREKCLHCGDCEHVCENEALKLIGYDINTEKLYTKLKRDEPFYKNTGGGVTFSGGEPLLQPKALKEILKRLCEDGINTAIETALYVPEDNLLEVSEYTDLFICDLKAIDNHLHIAGTGVSNDLILKNYQWIFNNAKRLWIRIPFIPGFNNDLAEFNKMAAFLAAHKVERVELFPYHTTGYAKYAAVGKPNSDAYSVPNDRDLLPFKDLLRNKGVNCI